MPSLAKKRAELKYRLEGLKPSEDDPHDHIHGVLLSDEIAFYAQNHHLISPFNPNNLKPAGYELTIGDEYFLSGEFLTLDPKSNDQNKIRIPPFEVAVLKTSEIVSLPRYLIARWNIKVSHAYSGLLWVGGPQVDPGYVGHLFCPIYNLSDKPVTLHLGEPIALIDFVKTTPFDKSKSDKELVRYTFPPKRLILEEYDIDALRSALYTKAGAKLEEFEAEIQNLGTRFNFFTQISFAIFALLISVVAVLSRINADQLSLSAGVWGATTVFLSVAALLIALFSYVNRRVGVLVIEKYSRILGEGARGARRYLQRAWLIGLATCVSLALVAAVGAYWTIAPFFENLRQQRVLVKSDLDDLGRAISGDVGRISSRVDQIEGKIVTTIELQELRAELEKEIQTIRSSLKLPP